MIGRDYSTAHERHHNEKHKVLEETFEEKDLGAYTNLIEYLFKAKYPVCQLSK